jgi:mRNA interferase MazF
MVTSQMARDADAIPLNSHDFARGTIHKPSNVRPNRLFTGANSLVDFQAGSLTQAKMDALTNAIVVVLQR